MADPDEQFEARIDRLVAAGRYGTRDEVLREGVRMLEVEAARWARFEAEIQKGVDDVEAGRVYPAEEVFDELLADLRARLPDRSAA